MKKDKLSYIDVLLKFPHRENEWQNNLAVLSYIYFKSNSE